MDGSENRHITGNKPPPPEPTARWRSLAPLFAAALVAAGAGLVVNGVSEGVDPEAVRIATLSHRAERLRGLTLLRPVEVEKIQRSELRTRVAAELAQEDDPELPGAEDALRLMAFLEPDETLAELYSDGAGDGILGFYDPETAKLSLVETGSLGATGATILHEIVHAIQDQRFDLDSTTLYPDDADAQLAARAVIEGDATESELRFLNEVGLAGVLGELGGGLGQLQGATPGGPSVPYLGRLTSLPYSEGSAFVTALRERGGQELLDQAFRDPPKTTLAILEPDRYGTDRDTARQIPAGRPPYRWERVLDETFGAADVYAMTDDRGLGTAWRGGRITVDRSDNAGAVQILIESERAADTAAGLREQFPTAAIRVGGQRVSVELSGPLPKR